MQTEDRQGGAQHAGCDPEGFTESLNRRRWLQRFGRVALGGALLPWLGACQPVPPAPLTLGMNAWVGYDPLVLAREQGLIDTQAVKVIELASNSESLRHFRNHVLDAAALTLDEALRLADEGFAPRVVAVLSESAGADVVMARPSLSQLDALRGCTVAVEASTVGALVLQRLLAAAGLSAADVRVINVEATQHAALLRSGRADAAVTYEPLAAAMRAEGFRALFDSRQMPGDIMDVLVVRDAVLSERPAQVQALLAGWQRGLAAVQRAPEHSASQLAPGADMNPSEYLAVAQGLRFISPERSLALLSGQPRALGQASDRLVRTLQAMELIRETPDWGTLLAPEPAEALRRSEGSTS